MSAKDAANAPSILAPQGVELPDNAPPHNHGHTTAAWFLTIFGMVGSILAGVGLPLESTVLIIAGIAVVVIGVVGGLVLSLAGKGQPHAALRR